MVTRAALVVLLVATAVSAAVVPCARVPSLRRSIQLSTALPFVEQLPIFETLIQDVPPQITFANRTSQITLGVRTEDEVIEYLPLFLRDVYICSATYIQMERFVEESCTDPLGGGFVATQGTVESSLLDDPEIAPNCLMLWANGTSTRNCGNGKLCIPSQFAPKGPGFGNFSNHFANMLLPNLRQRICNRTGDDIGCDDEAHFSASDVLGLRGGCHRSLVQLGCDAITFNLTDVIGVLGFPPDLQSGFIVGIRVEYPPLPPASYCTSAVATRRLARKGDAHLTRDR